MTPRDRIADLYRLYPQRGTFAGDEALHRITGVVIEGDDYYLLARGVHSKAAPEAILAAHVGFPRHVQDCWFIWAYCGSLKKIRSLEPYPLPLLGWVRRNGSLRFYDKEDIGKRCESRHTIFACLGRISTLV